MTDLSTVLASVQAVLGIVVIDLVLSGDNAVVIGMAARRLAPAQRRRAIVLGTAGAVGLRVLFTALVAVLLGIPLLQACGGVLLLWIAVKLLWQNGRVQAVAEGAGLAAAVRTIILADVVMSLDNILAVGGAAHGNPVLLLFGLGVSIPLILWGSSLVAAVMDRLPWLAYAGAAILVYTAVGMVFDDRALTAYLPAAWVEWSSMLLLVAGTLGLGYWRNARHRRPEAERVAADLSP